MENNKSGILITSTNVSYLGTNLKTGEKIFKHIEPEGSQDLIEYMGIIHAMMYIKKNSFEPHVIFSKMPEIIDWIKQKRYKSTAIRNDKNSFFFEKLDRADRWLTEQKRVPHLDLFVE